MNRNKIRPPREPILEWLGLIVVICLVFWLMDYFGMFHGLVK
jgi:hypothetical protein